MMNPVSDDSARTGLACSGRLVLRRAMLGLGSVAVGSLHVESPARADQRTRDSRRRCTSPDDCPGGRGRR
jgi:hypothetical protein